MLRLVAQMLVVLAGGGTAGALLVFLAFPEESPVPWPVLLAVSVLALAASLRAARALRP